jgi:5-methylcytosine-specific restriction enzyme B
MMLIESDKRGQELRLPYSRKEFSVPENVYILGMMNTADRSLAMIDYALRRRFSFFEMEPAFETESFIKYMNLKSNEEYKRLVKTMVDLNKAISNDPALGKGFCVGHSFLCTDDPITLEWLKEVIQYEIVPLLEEYWFDTPGVVSNWKANLFNSLK